MTSSAAGYFDHPQLSNIKRVILVAMLVLFGILVLRRSWVSEDAFITFRTVDNFANGYGLTWNVDERVQVYTHPLWMFLNSLVYFFTREIFFSNLFLSLAISVVTLILFSRWLASSTALAIFGILALSSSNAYIDYSTSGLENPLSHLLVVIFYALFFRLRPTTKKVFWLSLVVALTGLNRLDLVLLCIPAWLFALLEVQGKRKFAALLLGLLPLVVWELFSLFYYGFLFPNTAYAKLNTGIPTADLVRQGLSYLVNSLVSDPVTLVLILSGVITGFLSKSRRMAVCCAGIVLGLVYVVMIGGDFMSGRFLTVPLLCSVILLCLIDYSAFSPALAVLPFALLGLLNLAAPLPTIELTDPRAPTELIDVNGVADERRFYETMVGFSSFTRTIKYPFNTDKCIEGLQARSQQTSVVFTENIGYLGFCAGPQVHILDPYALADPLLSKLPIAAGGWRIGHFARGAPEGYLETLESGKNEIADPDLARYYDRLKIITRGDLWDWGRLAEIWRMNTGQYDPLLAAFQKPDADRLLSEIDEPKEAGTAWDAEGNTVMWDGFLIVDLERVCHAQQIEVSLDNNDLYEISFMKGGKTLNVLYLPPPAEAGGGLRINLVDVPVQVQKRGFDHIKIVAISGDGLYSTGHVRIIDPETGM